MASIEKGHNYLTFRFTVPKIFRPLHGRMIEKSEARRKETVTAYESFAQSVISQLLTTIVEVFPEKVDPTIVDTDVSNMSNEQLMNIQTAAHYIAPGFLLEEPIIEYVKARNAMGIVEPTLDPTLQPDVQSPSNPD